MSVRGWDQLVAGVEVTMTLLLWAALRGKGLDVEPVNECEEQPLVEQV